MIVVVDASVAAMWFLPERHSHNAALLFAPEYELLAPDLVHLEVASALLKAVRREEMTTTEGEEVLSTLLPAAVRTLRSADKVSAAFDIARRHGGSLYDAIYMAVARELDAPIVTNDARLAEIARMANVQASMIAAGPPVPSQTGA